MIKPTKARIMAAKKAIEAATISLKDFSKWSEVAATAALTAAAEVGDKRDEIIAGLQHHVQRLTKLLDDQLGTPSEQIRHAQEIAAAIERCALVADAFSDLCRCEKDVALQISAAIRALKDKP